MKRRVYLIILLVLILIVFLSVNRHKKNDIPIVIPTNLDKLESTLREYTKFKDSTIVKDDIEDKVILDDKYTIYVKKSYYMMNIIDTNDYDAYCDIVDAVEHSLGTIEGETLETCKYTLEGKINLDYISAKIYDNYRVLTVNYEYPTSIYDKDNIHSDEDIIPLEEVNYTIDLNNYLITSMSYNDGKLCGNVYSPKSKDTTFTFTIYNENKEKIESNYYEYTNDTKYYKEICIDIDNTSTAKYYRLEK